MHRLTVVGFDGLDIDREYPGAPGRGGKPKDTDNSVKLLETLRMTFDGSGNNCGLTFAAPSSYWYLRWFDLPNLVKYADWINLMTYNLHGVVSTILSFCCPLHALAIPSIENSANRISYTATITCLSVSQRPLRMILTPLRCNAKSDIASIVQGHTNLTESKLAAELFWRVKISPAKIVMGFDFYSRAFRLSDSGCSKPVCEF